MHSVKKPAELTAFGVAPRHRLSDMRRPRVLKKKKKKSDGVGSNAVRKKKRKRAQALPPQLARAQSSALNVRPRRQKKDKVVSPQKAKKKAPAPSSTAKLPLIRKTVKTKTKKKQLFVIGDHVRMSSDEHKWGVIRYKGGLRNVTGVWFGIELLGKDKEGDCDGEFNGERYFECPPRAGLFVMYNAIGGRMKKEMVQKLLAEKPTAKKGKRGKRRSSTLALAQALSAQIPSGIQTPSTPKTAGRRKRKSTVIATPPHRSSPTQSTTKPAKPVIASTASSASKAAKGSKQRPQPMVSQTPTLASLRRSASDRDPAIPTLSLSLNPDVLTASPLSSSQQSTLDLPSSFKLSVSSTPRGTTSKSAWKKTSGHKRAASGSESERSGRRKGKGRGPRKGSSRSPSGHRRTRSLSATREDTSWMTHRAETPKACRIRKGIEAQKRLDFAALMNRDSLKKKTEISKLFKKHIETAKATPRGMAGNGDGDGAMPNAQKLRDRLKNEHEAMENAVEIVKDLGFLKLIKENEVYSRIYIKKRTLTVPRKDADDDSKRGEDGEGIEGPKYDLFDMNNINVLSQFGGKMRSTLSKVICAAITRLPSIEIVEICNADVDADFMEQLVEDLCAYYRRLGDEARISILSLQSNPITDRGMMALCRLIRLNHGTLTQIKLQNNRRDISTLICQQVCEALDGNDYIVRFEFAFRHYQWRDHRDKSMKRNAERGRLKRLEMKKEMSM